MAVVVAVVLGLKKQAVKRKEEKRIESRQRILDRTMFINAIVVCIDVELYAFDLPNVFSHSNDSDNKINE